MVFVRKFATPFLMLLSIFISACETLPQNTSPQSTSQPGSKKLGLPSPEAEVAPELPQEIPEPVAPVDPIEQKKKLLAESLLTYEDGRYDDAISALTALLPATELPMSDQVTIQKFLAFSHCAMNRARQCREHFGSALSIDPTFQLSAAEKGHPVWGREFINARNAARNKRATTKKP